MSLRTVGWGILAGLMITAALAVGEGLMAQGDRFGLRTGIIGVSAGAMALGLALAMSLTSYWMASRDRGAALRQRLLVGAIFTGAAGMACGLSAAVLWLAAGTPWL